MEESRLEKLLKDQIEFRGGLCLKFVSPGWGGAPDRIVIRRGRVVFVEMKAPGEKPTPLQHKRHSQIEQRGIPVVVLRSEEEVQRFVEEYCL